MNKNVTILLTLGFPNLQAIERDIGPGPPGWMERQRERKTVQLGNIPRHSLRFKMILYGEYECAPRDQELTAEDLTFRSLDDDQPFQLSPLFSSSSDHPQHFTEIMCFRNDEIIATIKMIPQTGAIEIAEHTPVQVVEVRIIHGL